MKNTDLLIIGGGPAGLTAAIYASRAGLDVTVIEGEVPGGKLMNTHRVDNYAGTGILPGSDLGMNFYNHAIEAGGKIILGTVEKLKNISDYEKYVKLKNGDEYTSKAVIISTGLKSKPLNVSGFDKFFGNGVSICLVCDGGLYKERDILVYGGGLSAVEEVIYAADNIGNITLINPYPSFRATEAHINKLNSFNNVTIKTNTDIKEIKGVDKVESVLIESNGSMEEIKVDGVFSYAGWNPTTNFVEDKEILNENGFIPVNASQESKIKGIFSAGDIVPKEFKQVSIATSEGTIAALAAKKYIDMENKDGK